MIADEVTNPRLHVCLIEPFFTGSHARWARELKAASQHSIDLLTLPGRHWKWRMHGGAITLAQRFLDTRKAYDLIIASDMLDLTVFLSLARKRIGSAKTALYFHENQLAYPWSPQDDDRKRGRDLHYAFINYASALAADRLYFNSLYNRDSFINGLDPFLERYPDFQNKRDIDAIKGKSEVLPLGMDLHALEVRRPAKRTPNDVPLILWNHRWEYDKNPIGFFRILYALEERGLPFQVALLGEAFRDEPPYFRQAKKRLAERIVQYGRAERIEDYIDWLWRADIALVTSYQDFFGGSLVEAAYCGCHPILPKRLAYPEHFDDPSLFYDSEDQAIEQLAQLIESGRWKAPFDGKRHLEGYDWHRLAPQYDKAFDSLRSLAT